jgi:hypothetical protein
MRSKIREFILLFLFNNYNRLEVESFDDIDARIEARSLKLETRVLSNFE